MRENAAIEPKSLSSGSPARWLKWALVNLMVVAVAGVTARYKISYSLPQLGFENLIHAHSHFAFAGWASAALFATIIAYFFSKEIQESKILKTLFIANQLTSYGMLVSFLLQEYGPVSIGISTLSMIVSYFYAWQIWKHTAKNKSNLSVRALQFALICMILSTLGPYALAYMEASGYMNLMNVNNVVYWYLHFQYNGWFTFGVLAIALRAFEIRGGNSNSINLRMFVSLMIIACFPAYFISVLWTIPSSIIYILSAVGSGLQIVAFCFLCNEMRLYHKDVLAAIKGSGGWLLSISFLSLFVKLILQFACVFPALNKFVFGYRPVIIGYLHLVFIGFLTCFLLGTAIGNNVLNLRTRINVAGISLFIFGFVLTECGLLMHGVSIVITTAMHFLPLLLFVAASAMVGGLTLLVIGHSNNFRSASPLN